MSVTRAEDRTEQGDDDAVAAVWAAYKARGRRQLRDQLIVHYSPLVKYVAGRVSVGLPPSIEQADLVSYGIFGLIDAIEKYDAERGVKFETYAVTRIKGAIIDELRSFDWVPRTIRAKARTIEAAMAKLEGTLQRTPSDAELALEVAVSEPELHRVLAEVSFVGLAALDEVIGSTEGEAAEGTTLGDTVPDRAAGPIVTVEVEEMKRVLAGAISRLGEREKMVLTLYYYEGLTLAEIGRVLGVSESRACQIHTKAVLQLRGRRELASLEAV